MLGVTAIDGLRLPPAQAKESSGDTSMTEAALIEAVRRGIVGAMDAEEVAQEAFIRIFRGLPKFRGDAALSTWIYRLAVNAALSHRARRPPVPSDAAGDDIEGAPAESTLEGLEQALARLPAGYRTVVVLHDIEGLEHEEVAQILGCHVGTSKSQLHKARAKLRELLATVGITARALEEG